MVNAKFNGGVGVGGAARRWFFVARMRALARGALTPGAATPTAALICLMLGAVLTGGCRKASEAAADATTEAAFGLLRGYACEDKAQALLQRLDQQKIRQNEANRAVTAKSGDIVTLAFAVAGQALTDIGNGDLSLFCSARDIKVDEKAQRVTWVSKEGMPMYANFERADGKLTVVDIGVVGK